MLSSLYRSEAGASTSYGSASVAGDGLLYTVLEAKAEGKFPEDWQSDSGVSSISDLGFCRIFIDSCEWETDSGHCRIFLDKFSGHLVYEEPVGEGHGYIRGELFKQGTEESCWEGAVNSEDGEHLGHIRVKILVCDPLAPPFSLETRIRWAGDIMEWQAPVIWHLNEKGAQRFPSAPLLDASAVDRAAAEKAAAKAELLAEIVELLAAQRAEADTVEKAVADKVIAEKATAALSPFGAVVAAAIKEAAEKAALDDMPTADKRAAQAELLAGIAKLLATHEGEADKATAGKLSMQMLAPEKAVGTCTSPSLLAQNGKFPTGLWRKEEGALESTHVVPVDMQTLDSRLDYMVRYLEQIRRPLPDGVREIVLNAVKATTSWKNAERTSAELQCKIDELDRLMTVVGKHVQLIPTAIERQT